MSTAHPPRSDQTLVAPRSRFRLAWVLPAIIAMLVVITSFALALIAHREVQRLAVTATGERLRTPVAELAGLLARGPAARLAEVAEAAAAPPVHALLSGDRTALESAREILVSLQQQSTRPDGVELVTRGGDVVLAVEAPSDSLEVPRALRRPPAWREVDSIGTWVSAIQFADSIQWIDLASAVRGSSGTLGYVVRRRRLHPTDSQALSVINNLLGAEKRLSVGHPATGWSDLQGGERGPGEAVFAVDSALTYVASDGSTRIGRAAAVPGTPWFVWVEIPIEVARASTSSFLRELLLGGLLLVVLGGASLGAVLGRRLTRPIEELTAAAAAVAAGDLERRVTTLGPGEIGTLGLAFNEMAQQVADARRTLEARVAERTRLLEGYVDRLSESEERFRQLATSTPDAIIIGNSDGSIDYVNPAGEQMFGYAAGSLAGRPIRDLVPPDLRAAHEAGHARYVRTGVGTALGRLRELPALRKDGTQFPAELTLASWPQRGSRAIAVILRDITERRHLSDSVERRTRELEEANTELAAFSYSVSHDLRAPLRGILGFTQALLEDHAQSLNVEGRDYAGRIHAAAQRMSHLIDDLLELSRVSRTHLAREAVDLVPIAAACLDELRRREPGRQVDYLHPDRLEVRGDERLLRQLVQNLVENAWKFTTPRARARIEIAQEVTGRGVAICVRDNGVGFDPRYASRLFGVFQRLHSDHEFPGTGVGLAIVQRIVHRHGGTVWAESAPDSGAAFYFTLNSGGLGA